MTRRRADPREAFEHNKINNTLHVARDGEGRAGLPVPARCARGGPRPDLILDLNLPKYDGRQLLRRSNPMRTCAHPGGGADHLVGRRTFCAATNCTPTPMSQAGGPRPVHERGSSDRRVLRPGRALPNSLTSRSSASSIIDPATTSQSASGSRVAELCRPVFVGPDHEAGRQAGRPGRRQIAVARPPA